MRGPSSRPPLPPVGIPGLAFALSPQACPEQRPFHTRVPVPRAFSDSEVSGLRGEGLCRILNKQPRLGLAWENEGPAPGTRREGPVSWGCPGISPAFRGQLGGAGAEPLGPAGCPGECDSVGLGWGWRGGRQSCSWLGIGAGFLSGREGARSGERGQQQTGTPLLFSLPLLPSAGKAR